MTDLQFAAWLASPTAIRLVLIEVVANVSGVETTRYLSTKPYVTGASDTPANTAYLPIVTTGIQFTEQISLTGGASLSAGDVEILNVAGERDSWLSDIWVNRSIQAFIGDPSWPRSDFRTIFNGIVSDIGSKSRDKLNLMLRDKMQRLNTPVSETVLGGSAPNKDKVIPILLGECHNITPLLSNPATLEYQVHDGAVEQIFEVRDNGIAVSTTVTNSTGKFTLNQQPAGTITASVQGDKPSTYQNTISQLIQRLVTGYGKASDRFVSGDLDATNLAAFDAAHTQPVGIYLDGRENVLSVCEQLAASLAAQLVMSRDGKMRLIQISLPPSGTPTVITAAQMVARSLHVIGRTTVVASIKLGYCKNWTVQPGLLTAIPAQHKDLFALEWLTATSSDSTTKTTYKLNSEPIQQDTMLLTNSDAAAEALRRLNLLKVPRTIYQFDGTADLLTLELGGAVTLVHPRYGMSGGLTGMVVSLAPNWMTGHVTVGVII
jgi:hypothetical protein